MSTKSTEEAMQFLDKLTGDKLTFGNMLASIRKCEEMSLAEFAKVLGGIAPLFIRYRAW